MESRVSGKLFEEGLRRNSQTQKKIKIGIPLLIAPTMVAAVLSTANKANA